MIQEAERELEGGKSVFIYPIFVGARVAIGDSGSACFDDVW
jgi:hypothetical protein